MSRIFTSFLLIGSALIAGSGAARADDDEIVITARFPVENTASSVTVVTAEDIARKQSPTVLEALRGAPGVTLSQNGGLGQSANIRLRGADDDHTLVLIDGVPANDPSGLVGFDFSYFDAGIVQRIEVLRGDGSAIWGADAIGGVINIVTLGAGRDGVGAYAEAGSFNTGRMGAHGAWSSGPLAVSGYASVFDTDGISAADERDGNTEKDGARGVTLGARAQYAFGGGFTAAAGYRTTQGHAAYDEFGAPTGVADSNAEAATRESLGDVRLSWRAASGRWGVAGAASRGLTLRSYASSFPGTFRGERTQGRVTIDGELAEGQTVLAGYEHERIETSSFDGFSTLGGKSDSDAVFATYNGQFGDRLLLEGAARYEQDDRYGSHTTGRAGAAIKLWAGGRARATAGTAYRAPTIDEVTGGCCTGPNSNLKPVTSTEWEIGLDQTFWDGRGRFGITYFDREVKDAIVFGALSYLNQPGVTDSKGVELTAGAKLGAIDADFSYTHNEVSPRASGVQSVRIPRDQAALDLTWRTTDTLTLGANIIWNGKENDVNTFTFTPVENAAWTTVALRGAVRLSDRAELYGRIENALDETYQDIFGYGAPGRAAYIGIRVKK
jgi:vitamin B12 transporter